MSEYTNIHRTQRRQWEESREGGAQGATSGTFTALTLILLTFVVYLFSLSIPNSERHQAVYASLAKAFLFEERQLAGGSHAGRVQLMSGPRESLRVLTAHMAAAGTGELAWEGGDLVLTLSGIGAEAASVAPHRETLARLAAMARETGAQVRVEAFAEGERNPVAERSAALSRATRLATAMVNSGEGLAAGQVSAAGYAVPRIGADGLPQGGGRVRVVLKGAEVSL